MWRKSVAYSTVKNKAQYKTDSRVVQKLIDKGVNINQLDEKERVPLQYLINLNIQMRNLNHYIKFGLHRTVFWLITRMHGEKHHWKLRSKCRIEQVCWRG